jgi:hypothetical protein
MADVALWPIAPNTALQFFCRYWGHSGHRDALEPEGRVAIDPVQTFGPRIFRFAQ